MNRRTFCASCSVLLGGPFSALAQTREDTFCASYLTPAQRGNPIATIDWDQLGFPKIGPMLDLITPLLDDGLEIEASSNDLIAQSGLFKSSKRIVVGISDLSSSTLPLFVITLLHEFGHWLQLGRQASDQALKLARLDPLVSMKIELHADYLSGFLLHFVNARQERDARCPETIEELLSGGQVFIDLDKPFCTYVPDLVRLDSVLVGIFDFRSFGQNWVPGATHPTPEQRLFAVNGGYLLGRLGLSGREALLASAEELGISALFVS